MIRPNLCDFSDACIHLKSTVTVPNTEAAAEPVNNTNKKVIFKNCAPYINCIKRINNTQADDAQDLDIVVRMYNLIGCSDVYSKTLASLSQYCRDKSALDNNGNIIDFPANNNNSIPFKFKQQIIGQTRRSDPKMLK